MQRNRKENDFLINREKLLEKIASFQSEIDNILNKIAVLAETESYVKEILKIQAALNLQDELDKQTVSLYGLKSGLQNTEANKDFGKDYDSKERKDRNASNSPKHRKPFQKSVFGGGGFEKEEKPVVQLNKMCASCSGQNQHIVKLFKMACL